MKKVLEEKEIRDLIENAPDMVPDQIKDIYNQADALSLAQKSVNNFIQEMKELGQYDFAGGGPDYSISVKIKRNEQ